MKMIEPHSFRATSEAWLGQLLLPLVFFVLLTTTAINQAGLHPVIGSMGLALLILIVVQDYFLPMARNWLSLDSRSMEGSVNGRFFHLYWPEVIAAWMVDCKRKRYLCIGTAEGTLILPMRFFDDQAVWRVVRAMVPSEALNEKAVLKLPDYREWVEKRANISCSGEKIHTVADHWLIPMIGWIGLSAFIFIALKAFRTGDYAFTAILAGLAILCLVALTRWGINEIGPEVVARRTMLGGGFMQWDEVRWIEVDPLSCVIVLVGENCQLAISGPGLWAGVNKTKAVSMLMSQAENRRIPLRRTFWALLRVSRNARVTK